MATGLYVSKIWSFILSGIYFLSWTALIWGCQSENTRFVRLSADETGIVFSNDIIEDDTFNIVLYEYIYNGGGVGVGDFNRDGKPDVFFSGNRVSSALYLQEEEFRFADITKSSGVSTAVWCAGVNVIDINQDGWDDIYICTLHPDGITPVPNILFVNQGLTPGQDIPHFINMAKEYRLDATDYSTQSAVLDYDLDGDLDLYLLNNAVEGYNRNIPKGVDSTGHARSVDRLFRNDGVNDSLGHPVFTDVSKQMGIKTEGWGLGVAVTDINSDGYPDIYAANDFLSNDLLWVNQQGHGFKNTIDDFISHQSYNSMGIDIADINNDSLPEIIVLDMLPDDNERQKRMFSKINTNRYQLNIDRGYAPQFVRNTLQYNHGCGYFSDIGYLAGVAATDWSWAPLLADLDNDGYRDLLVTNGYPKDITDLDFLKYRESLTGMGSEQARLDAVVKDLKNVGGVYQANFFFRNRSDLTFEDVTSDWIDPAPSFSNGAAYADLDMDGDLDILVNNINGKASILKNGSRQHNPDSSYYLKVKLIGSPPNRKGIGAKIYVFQSNGSIQFHEHYLSRGYLSSVGDIVHFGLGAHEIIDSLKVSWPDGSSEVRYLCPSDSIYTFEIGQAKRVKKSKVRTRTYLSEIEELGENSIFSMPNEKMYRDHSHHRLWLKNYSQQGTLIRSGDFDGNGYDDLIIGGSAGHVSKIIYFDENIKLPIKVDSLSFMTSQPFETTAIEIFDANGDGSPDVYFGHGSSEFTDDSEFFQDHLYLNSGDGNFYMDERSIPEIRQFTGAAASGDVDGDGDQDLFVGGLILVDSFPYPPGSFLLINEGGKFIKTDDVKASGLERSGMITTAQWTDIDGDGWTDLITAGEFCPVVIWRNHNGSRLIAEQVSENEMHGWWQSLEVVDWDGDGDVDIIAGNMGVNGPLNGGKGQPVCVAAADYDKNGSLDPLFTSYIQGESYPVHPRESLLEQLPGLASQIPDFATYATWRSIDLPKLPEEGIRLCAEEFRSALFINDGKGSFTFKPLPSEAQFSPLRSSTCVDIDYDGQKELIGVGNDYGYEVLGGRYDAGLGVILSAERDGSIRSVPGCQSGFLVKGDTRNVIQLQNRFNDHIVIVVSFQSAPPKFFQLNGDPKLSMN